MKADIKFVCQELSYDDNDMPINTITYDQHFVFTPYSQNSNNNTVDGTAETNDRDEEEDSDLFTPTELAKLPFNETSWNMQLGNELQENVPALKDVKLPLEVPVVPNQAQFLISGNGNDKGIKFVEGAVAGIFVTIALIFTAMAAYGLRQVESDLESEIQNKIQNKIKRRA